MSSSRPLQAPQLSPTVNQVLQQFLSAAKESLGEHLLSIVLYGSAAEGKLRATSDVNLILVLTTFKQAEVDLLRTPLRVAQSAIELRVMFLLKDEIPQAAHSFASKFSDILRRRVVLYGNDPFVSIAIPQEARILELKQQILNQVLRLRALYVSRSLRKEQLSLVIAHAVGPLRSSAAALLEIQESPAISAQQALERLGSELGVPNWSQTVALLSSLQDSPIASTEKITNIFFAILDFACRMQLRMETLTAEVRRESV
jgi:predicted nucleotidyltransferase